MFLLNKLNLKILIYLFLILTIILSIFYLSKSNYLLLSRLDPNYWLIETNDPNKNKLFEKLYNLTVITKKNSKFKDKALFNIIYHFDQLNDKEKINIIENI